MPKIFRPTLKQAAVSTKPVEHASEQPVLIVIRPELQPVLENPTYTLPVADQPTAEPQSVEPEVVQAVIETSPTDLDLEIDAKETGTSRQDLRPRVKLFETKRTRRRRTKVSEPVPSVDEPLNRSSVTLRSLLNWVPSNKPPPTYRRERSSNSMSSATEPNNNATTQPPDEDTKPVVLIKSSPDKFALGVNKEENYVDPLAPQLRLDADGNIVLDESSLTVRRPEFIDTENLKHVIEETGILGATYNSFRRRPDRYGGRWTEQETVRFYRALATMGTDFYSMEKLFPNRTRPELKRKFKREEKINPYLVNQALRNRRTYDVTALIPLSDDEENEKEEKNKDDTDATEKPKSNHKFPKIEHRKRRRQQTAPDPKAKSRIMETIDSVLSQTDAYLEQAESSGVNSETLLLPYEYRTMFANLDNSTYEPDPSTASLRCNQSLLDRMIAHKEAELAAVQQSFVIEDLNPSILGIANTESPNQSGLLIQEESSPRVDLVKLCKEMLGQE